MKVTLLSLLICLSQALVLNAQNLIQYNTSNTSTGLSCNKVNNIYFDSENKAYIGTEYGLSVFDGENWERFTTDDWIEGNNDVAAFTKDSAGDLWVAAFGLLRRTNSEWEYYNSQKSLAHIRVLSLAVDASGAVIAGTANGLSVYDGSDWKTYTTSNGLAGNSIRAIAIDKSGKIWFATDGGVSVLQDSVYTNYTDAEGLPSNEINDIVIDKTGNVWVATEKGAAMYNGGKWYVYHSIDGFSGNNLKDIEVDGDNNIWLSDSYRVYKFDGKEWHTVELLKAYESVYVTDIKADNYGNVWIATSYGIIKYEQNRLVHYTSDGLMNNDVIDICQDRNGAKWFTTWQGISVLDDGNWQSFVLKKGLLSNSLSCIEADIYNNIWVGGSSVWMYDGKEWIEHDMFEDDTRIGVRDILCDEGGNVWIASYTGIYRYDGTAWMKYSVEDNLPDSAFFAIEVDKQGNKWFTYKNGLVKFDGLKWTDFSYDNLSKEYDPECFVIDKFDRKIIETLMFDGEKWTDLDVNNNIDGILLELTVSKTNELWYTCGSHLKSYDGNEWTDKNFRSKSMMAIHCDNNNNLWLGSNRDGVFVYNDNGIDLTADTKPEHFLIKGRVFLDKNENGTLDLGEKVLRNQKVSISPDKSYTLTNNSGEFSFYKKAGTYSVEVIAEEPNTAGINDMKYTLELSDDTMLGDIGLFGPETTRFTSYFHSSMQRCGSTTEMWYTLCNVGNQEGGVLAALTLDPQIEYKNAIPQPDSLGEDGRLFWHFNNCQPLKYYKIELSGILPTGTLDTLQNITEVYNDEEVLRDTFSIGIRCSFDPNDKQVSPAGIGEEKLTLMDESLTYTVRFQNTGNDVAYDIAIFDTLDVNLDLSTFKLESFSHEPRVELSAETGKLVFYFDNIFLPDSASNNELSNGYVSYSIHPKASLSDKTLVENKASIYFDSNPPVVTNTTANTLVYSLPSQTKAVTALNEAQTVSIYPNPASSYLNVELQSVNEAVTVTVYATNSTLIKQIVLRESATINIEDLATGLYFVEIKTDSYSEIKQINIQ